jgi:hypothetical protein
MRNCQSNYPTVHSWSPAIICFSETWGKSCVEMLLVFKQLWNWSAWQILCSLQRNTVCCTQGSPSWEAVNIYLFSLIAK